MLVHLSLFMLFQGVETSGTCVGTPQSVYVVSKSCSVCLELRRQARVLVHFSLFELLQGVETSGTCIGTPQSVCVVCFRELTHQTRVLVHLSMFVLDVS